MYQFSADKIGKDIQEHECETTGCVLGHSLRLLKKDEFIKMHQDCKHSKISIYYKLVQDYFGIEFRGVGWSFLFGAKWPNDPLCCIERIQYYLENEMDMDMVQLSELTDDYSYHFGKTTINFIRVENK